MKNDGQSILFNENNEIKQGQYQNSFFVSALLLLINLSLMAFVGFYWTNTGFHQYFSGRPL